MEFASAKGNGCAAETTCAHAATWAAICNKTGLSKGTAQRAFYSLPKNQSQHIF